MSRAAIYELHPPEPPAEPFAAINNNLVAQGWAVVDDFVSPEWAAQLLEEQQLQARQGAFRLAGIGRNHVYQLDSETRSDQILWLEQGNSMPAQRQYLDLLEELRRSVNRDLFLGLYDLETHAAIYPPGSFYSRHLDGFLKGNLRTLTVILYLNRNWHSSDGGALRLYLHANQDSQFLEVLPESGRLVAFFSDIFYHEVLETRRKRSSITSWFSRRPQQ
jgi:SM-20-related protein